MFTVNKLLFLYVLITFSILMYLENVRTKQRNKDDKEVRKANEKVTSFVGELVRGARDIKMLNSEQDFINELSKKIDYSNNKRYIMYTRNNGHKLFNFELLDLSYFVLVMLLMFYMKNDYISAAVALIFYNYAGRLTGAIFLFGSMLEYFKEFNLSVERVHEIINGDDFKKEEFGDKHLDKVIGNFEFKNVTFNYNDDAKVLDDISFRVNANETVAFVGKSGVGKSTIFSLLCKMYKPDKGLITIDGVDINTLDKESIRGNITIINQDPYIFNLSIKDNLRLVKSNVTDEEIIEACKTACLDDFIENLPDKYETMIGEGGVNLSGGQKQRLAIARALIQKTEIILFDEATSALDNETQSKIQKAISNMKGEYTILIIAHRLSTIINSDRILFIEDGKVSNEGTHDYLIKNCEDYRNLYESEIYK